MSTTETPAEALQRIQRGQMGQNDIIAIMAFADCGIDPEAITPRENVLTFKAWKAKGRQVAKGAISVPVTVWIPCKGQQTETTEPEESGKKKAAAYMRPKVTRLFHVSQTIAIGAPKGTRPEAWNNPALIRAGTYETADDLELATA